MITGIVGMDRGGTSAVAVVVKALGVHMYGCDHTLDDTEMWGSRADRSAVLAQRNALVQRNALHHPYGWGWKYPFPWGREDVSWTDRYIVVYRCPVARAVHGRAYNQLQAARVEDSLQKMKDLMLVPEPKLMVSYEKLLTDTRKVVQSIADFLEVPMNEDAIKVVDHVLGYESTKKYNEGDTSSAIMREK